MPATGGQFIRVHEVVMIAKLYSFAHNFTVSKPIFIIIDALTVAWHKQKHASFL